LASTLAYSLFCLRKDDAMKQRKQQKRDDAVAVFFEELEELCRKHKVIIGAGPFGEWAIYEKKGLKGKVMSHGRSKHGGGYWWEFR
jgi:hypothetical protein